MFNGKSLEQNVKKNEVIIIGGGPAGMMAAIQLKRYGIDACLFEQNRLGGLLWNANLVENYPGFPGGIPGPELVQLFSKQFQDLSLEPTREAVLDLDYDGANFVVTTGEARYLALAVIVATGTRPITFPEDFIPGAALPNTYYEVAPLLGVAGKRIAIIGAGDAAFDYAINLSRNNRVWILNRTQEIKSLPLLVQRCAKIQDVEYYPDMPVTSVTVGPEGLVLKAIREHEYNFNVDYLIGAIGREEQLPPISARLRAEKISLVQSERLHFVGDVHNGIYRQTAIAVGDGLKAAMKVYRVLKEQDKQ